MLHIYINYLVEAGVLRGARVRRLVLSGSHLSNATCLTQVFFKSGEECSKLRWFSTRQKAHKTNEACIKREASDKQCHPKVRLRPHRHAPPRAARARALALLDGGRPHAHGGAATE